MENETKGLKILWGNCCGGSIILTQPSFSFSYMKLANMLVMWFFRDISKNIPPYSMLRAKYFIHVKGGNQNLSNMKYLVKQVLRATGIANINYLVVQDCSSRKMKYLYLGVRHLFNFICLSSVKIRLYETISWKKYFNALLKRKGKCFGEQ